VLRRDFGFDGLEQGNLKKALLVLKSGDSSIFGVDPAREDVVIETSSAFEAWKCWKKASYRFYLNPNQLVNGPYFLRAALFWKKILEWCDDTSRSRSVGPRIRESLRANRGMRFEDWPEQVRHKPGTHACQAIYAFNGGQDMMFNPDNAFDGLLGGHQAYSFYSSLHLVTPQYMAQTNVLIVAQCHISVQQRISKFARIDPDTGSVLYGSSRPLRAVNTASETPAADEFLLWLEEYATRLDRGQIGVGHMGSTPRDIEAITLFPRFPSGSLPVLTEGVQPVSRAVTRGVEVIASGVYVPQGSHQYGFIYSIRIRLLTPHDEGYQSAAQRGFETCQLHTRQWRITDNATGQTEQVDGEGVIGMYPLLREGGYSEGGDEFSGTFQYQSCTRAMNGSFQGYLRFVSGSLRSPTGEPFNIELRPFALDNRPAYLY
jgi:uncharacterized protein affecting Mg2+/Co2+ transport